MAFFPCNNGQYELVKKDIFNYSGYASGINFTITKKASYFCQLTYNQSFPPISNYVNFLKNGTLFGTYNNYVLEQHSPPGSSNITNTGIIIWKVDLNPGDIITCPNSNEFPTYQVYFTF